MRDRLFGCIMSFVVPLLLIAGFAGIPVAAADRTQGTTETFWVRNGEGYGSINAELSYVGREALVYVAEGTELAPGVVGLLGMDVDNRVIPRVRGAFGAGTRAMGDGGLTIVIANLAESHDGYFDPKNLFNMPYSNNRRMIVINGRTNNGTGDTLLKGMIPAIAHEYQHLIHYEADPNEELWVTEGLSQYAEYLVGGGLSRVPWFLSNPATSLNEWGWSLESYGATASFFAYLAGLYSKNGSLAGLVANEGNGIDGISSYLSENGFGVDFKAVFLDWTRANRHDPKLTVKYAQSSDAGTISVPAWSAGYVEFPKGIEPGRPITIGLVPEGAEYDFLFVPKDGKPGGYKPPTSFDGVNGTHVVQAPPDPRAYTLLIRNVGRTAATEGADPGNLALFTATVMLGVLTSGIGS